MNEGKLVFAQLMQHLPLTTFRRCTARYQDEFKVKSFSCLDQFLCMAFAQLTYRESLRDIEACLRAQHAKLYHLGIRSVVARNTLANANAVRDWRIYADFAQRLIGIARPLYAEDPFGVDLKDTVYALDATTIDLCLSVFPWAPFRSTKAAVKLHTLLDLHGNIPAFIRISDGKFHEVNILDELLPEAGAFYIMDRGFTDFARLYRFHEAGSFFIIRSKSNLKVQRRYSHAVDRSTGLLCDQTVIFTGFYSRQGFEAPLRCIRTPGRRDRQTTDLPDQQLRTAGRHHHRAVSMPLASGTVFQMDQTASAYQSLLWHLGECGQVADLDRGIGLCAGRHRQKAAQYSGQPLRNPTDSEPHAVRTNPIGSTTYTDPDRSDFRQHTQPVESV